MLKLRAQCVCECVKPSMVENGGKGLRLPQREGGKNRRENSTDSEATENVPAPYSPLPPTVHSMTL